MRLAIFGGTFDPVHDAHLAIASAAADRFALDRILFVPAAQPPHKAGAHAPYEDRVRMVELACAGHERFQASRLEEGTARSYSIDTIRKVQAGMQPGDRLFFLIGADAFAEFRTWLQWREVARAVEFLVISRPGHAYDTPPEVRMSHLDNLELQISSSEVRAALGAGRRPSGVPEAVLEYIFANGLYGARVSPGPPRSANVKP